MDNVTMSLFGSSTAEDAPLEQIAELYCSVWREPPWCEDFWIKEEVLNDIKTELQKPCAALVVAMVDDFVAGFAWGYEVFSSDLAHTVGADSLEYLFNGGTRVGYIDELAVGSRWRGHGVGSRLNTELVSVLCTCGVSRITLRTDEQAVAAKRVYVASKFEELDVRDVRYPNRTYWLWTAK